MVLDAVDAAWQALRDGHGTVASVNKAMAELAARLNLDRVELVRSGALLCRVKLLPPLSPHNHMSHLTVHAPMDSSGSSA